MRARLSAAGEGHEGVALDRMMRHVLAGLDGQVERRACVGALVERLTRALRQGSVCLEAADWEDLRAEVIGSPLLGEDGGFSPLVVEGGRVYFQRYWQYESALAAELKRVAAGTVGALDVAALRSETARMEAEGLVLAEGQKQAVAHALAESLTLVAGGPGTGKTTVVRRLLRLLAAGGGGRVLRVALVAPTGRAASRLREVGLGVEGVRCEAGTLHRMLGARGQGGRFVYGQGRTLPWDVLILDEASMVDLPMMARLFSAVGIGARVVLLGDPDQLGPVGAGSVFADMVGAWAHQEVSASTVRLWEGWTGEGWPVGVGGRVLRLAHNYRSGGARAVAALCEAIREGQAEAVLEGLRGGEGLTWASGCPDGVGQWVRALVESPSQEEALALLGQWRVLCGVRGGEWGVEGLNARLEAMARGCREACGRRAGHGTPVVVVENCYERDLFNGDMGVMWEGEGMGVCFGEVGGGVRVLPLSQMPRYEAAWAMTVHKAQGSECEQVWAVLPLRGGEWLSRELVYTAVSRARRGVHVSGAEAVLVEALGRRAGRASGLGARLSGV